MTTLTAAEAAEAARDLRAIRDHIQRVGHWRGGTFFEPGVPAPIAPCCLAGAAQALGIFSWPRTNPSNMPWWRALHRGLRRPTDSLAIWSDTTPTPELLATLTRVADQLDGVLP